MFVPELLTNCLAVSRSEGLSLARSQWHVNRMRPVLRIIARRRNRHDPAPPLLQWNQP